MGLWQRFKGFVNKQILRRGEEMAPAPPPAPPPIPEPSFAPEPVYQPPEQPLEIPDNYIHIVDDFGVDRGTQTYEGWYQDTLLSSEEFHLKYGYDFYNTDIIEWLEDYYGIEWDWDTWRTEYEARNG